MNPSPLCAILRQILRNRASDPVQRLVGLETMKRIVLVALCVAVLPVLAPVPAVAGLGVIDRACRSSDRSAATPQLCSCIQKVANSSLNRGERRKVAKWFSDPHQAQVVRQSDRSSDETLWKRYKAFGEQAQKTCE